MIDAAVIGSGHNALVSAAYLTEAGWSVRVLERDTVVGGAASTVERFPGHKVDRGSSAHIMVRQPGIIEELRLAEHGLRPPGEDPQAPELDPTVSTYHSYAKALVSEYGLRIGVERDAAQLGAAQSHQPLISPLSSSPG